VSLSRYVPWSCKTMEHFHLLALFCLHRPHICTWGTPDGSAINTQAAWWQQLSHPVHSSQSSTHACSANILHPAPGTNYECTPAVQWTEQQMLCAPFFLFPGAVQSSENTQIQATSVPVNSFIHGAPESSMTYGIIGIHSTTSFITLLGS